MNRKRPRRSGFTNTKEAHRAHKHGLTYQEIADRMGIPRSTVQWTEIQAMKKLRAAFAGDELPPVRGYTPFFKCHEPDCD